MRLAYGTDTRSAVTDEIRDWLIDSGHELVAVCEDQPWPEVGIEVGRAVAEGHADCGVVWCFTGTGVSIAANRVPGVRAALCGDRETGVGARRWNDANVCALSMRLVTAEVAREILTAFMETSPDPAEAAHIALLDNTALPDNTGLPDAAPVRVVSPSGPGSR